MALLLVGVTLVLASSCAYGALPAGYQSLSAEEKLSVLWEKTNVPYSGIYPTEGPSPLSMAALFYPPSLVKSFSTVSDEFGEVGREKLIHTYGSVAPIEFRIFSNSSYSGVFRAGSTTKGLVRLSIAKYDVENFTPGMGLKLLVDGKPSLNIITMFSLDGQGPNQNFFRNSFWNVIEDPSSIPLKLLAKAFTLSLRLIPGSDLDRPEAETNLPLYEHASMENNGQIVNPVRAPYRITFIPNSAVGWSATTSDDFRVKLGEIPSGSRLYTIAVNRLLSNPQEIVGELVTTAPFVASPYGDQQLFFQHHAKRWRST